MDILEKSCKELREACYLLMLMAVLDLIKLVSAIIGGDFSVSTLPADSAVPAATVQNFLIVIALLTVLFCLTEIYLSLKGMQIVKKPTAAKGHIWVARILTVIAAVGALSSVLSLLGIGDTGGDLASAVIVLAEFGALLVYSKRAKLVRSSVLNGL